MKFSICTTSRKEVPLKKVIQKFSAIPVSGIEIWDGHIDEYIKMEDINHLKKLLNSYRMECVCISPYFNLQNRESGAKSFETVRRCISYCKSLDCTLIRTFLGDKPYRMLQTEEKESIVEWLKKITLLGEKNGITFAIETHYGMPSDDTDFILSAIQKVGSSNLKVLFDGFNYLPDNSDMMEQYRKLEPYVVHHHIKNYLWKKNRPVSLGRGDVDFKSLMQELKKKEIYCSFEYFCRNQYDLISKSIDWVNGLLE